MPKTTTETEVMDRMADVTTYTFDTRGDVLATVNLMGNVTGGNPSAHTTTYLSSCQLLFREIRLTRLTTCLQSPPASRVRIEVLSGSAPSARGALFQ